MTVKEFSKKVGVSENAIRRKLERGTLHGEKVNGRWNVLDTDYLDYRLCRNWRYRM